MGNLNKPKGQTTLLPPYEQKPGTGESNITLFLDAHDIGQIAGVGFVRYLQIPRCFFRTYFRLFNMDPDSSSQK